VIRPWLLKQGITAEMRKEEAERKGENAPVTNATPKSENESMNQTDERIDSANSIS
jgi:hypothetical protein